MMLDPPDPILPRIRLDVLTKSDLQENDSKCTASTTSSVLKKNSIEVAGRRLLLDLFWQKQYSSLFKRWQLFANATPQPSSLCVKPWW